MRDFKGMKRQRGRNRGGGGGKPQHNANRAFESNGPDGVKVRGNAQTVFEKYQQLARDAASSGDRVIAENHLQHAEHYFRLLRAMQPQRAPSDIIGRDQFSSGMDIDFEAEPEEGAETPNDGETSEGDGEGQPQHQQQQGRQRDDRPRDDRQRDDRQRDDRPQGEGRRRDRWRERDDRRDRFERGDRQGDQPREPRDPMPVVDPHAQAQPQPSGGEGEGSPVLRSASGDVSHAPAFLGAPRAEGEDSSAPKPRRGRKPKVTADEEA